MPINPFEGFQFDSSADVNHVENTAFQQALMSGDQHKMRSAVFGQASNVLMGGSQSFKKAKRSEAVLQQALEETGGQNDDSLESRRKFLARAQKLAIEAGLPEIAMQAGDQLTQVTDLEMQRAKLKADTSYTEVSTAAVSGSERRAELKGLRDMETEELLTQKAALEATIPGLNSPEAREGVQNRVARIDAIVEDKRIEFERSKQYDVKEFEVQGPDGETYTRTIAVNKNDPNDTYTLGEAKTKDIAGAAGGRQLATIEKIANDNRIQGFEASRDYNLGRRAYNATKVLGARGWRGKGRTAVLAALGAEDEAEYNKKLVDQATKVRALDLLPPGSASDKDVQIVMDTTLNPNSSKESLERVFAAQMRLAEWEREYTTFIDQYLASADTPSIVGAQAAWRGYAEQNVAGLDKKINDRVNKDLGLTPTAAPSHTQAGPKVTVTRRGRNNTGE